MENKNKYFIKHVTENPEFLQNLCDTIADAICILILNYEPGNTEDKDVIDKLALIRLNLRKL